MRNRIVFICLMMETRRLRQTRKNTSALVPARQPLRRLGCMNRMWINWLAGKPRKKNNAIVGGAPEKKEETNKEKNGPPICTATSAHEPTRRLHLFFEAQAALSSDMDHLGAITTGHRHWKALTSPHWHWPQQKTAVGQRWVPKMACPGKWKHGLEPGFSLLV